MKFLLSKAPAVSGLFAITAIIYVSMQIFLGIIDRYKISDLQDSICKAVELNLQTGAIREVFDYTNSNLKIALPLRRYHVVLSEESVVAELGAPLHNGIVRQCRPAGRTDSILNISIEMRPFNEARFWIFGGALLISAFLFLIAIGIRRKTQDLTLQFFEAELSRLFGVPLASKMESTFLSRFFDPSKSLVADRVHRNILDLRSQIEMQTNQIKQQSVKAALGELITHVAHDMRSPLSLLSILSQRSDYSESRDLINKAVERLNCLAEDVLNTRRSLLAASDIFDVGQVIESVIQMTMVSRRVNIRFVATGDKVSLLGSSQELVRVLTILIDNSVEAVDVVGSIIVTLCSDLERNYNSIIVEDNGCGLPESFLSSSPEEWRSTKVDGNGLGLRFVQNWVLKIGGRLDLHNNSSGGARIAVHLPKSGILSEDSKK